MIRRRMFAVLLCVLLAGCSAPVVQTAAAGASATTALPQSIGLPTAQATSIATPQPTVAALQAEELSAGGGQAAEASPVEVSLMAVGDIMFHGAQITAAYDAKTKTWAFDDSFRYVKHILSSADLTLGNFECTMAGPKKPWSQPMSFNVPDSAANALSAAGFDVLATANNHTNDRGRDGLIRTVETIRAQGMTAVGTRRSVDEKPYAIVDVKGIKVGVTSYAWGSRNGDLLNLYPTDAAKAKPLFAKTVKDMKADGADIVLFYIHWGAEYQRAPNASQKKLAQALADVGVDIVCGSHPHVLQSVSALTGSGGNKTVVAWSLGDFLSNQITRWDPKMFKYTEDEMILNLKLRKADGKTTVTAVQYLPVWNMYTKVKGKARYNIVPIEKALKNSEAFGLPGAYERKKAAQALANTDTLLRDALNSGVVTKLMLP